MANLSKPFVFGISVDSKHFIGREKEIERLSANFRYGVNTIMISPRRIGKTSLVKQVSKTIEDKNIKIVHLDIFSCRSEYDFLNMFASALLQQTSSHADEWKQNIRDFLARVTPKITLSPDPTQEFSISLGITPKTYKPEEILNLPQLIAEKRGYHIVMCIDEFQQIGDFPDSLTVQKKMRTIWQHQQNVSYCLYGSKKNMMSALFQQQSKPFYKFGQIMTLDTIPTETWVPYICSRFATEGKPSPRTLPQRYALWSTTTLHTYRNWHTTHSYAPESQSRRWQIYSLHSMTCWMTTPHISSKRLKDLPVTSSISSMPSLMEYTITSV